MNPLFTCFGSANEWLPINPRDAFYYETTPDFFGFTPNRHLPASPGGRFHDTFSEHQYLYR
jgi:hypothetical protein